MIEVKINAIHIIEEVLSYEEKPAQSCNKINNRRAKEGPAPAATQEKKKKKPPMEK